MIGILSSSALVGLLCLSASAASAAPTKFRGEYICGATRGWAGQLRTMFDATVDGDKIQFARPLFNPDGSRVVGVELAEGKVDADGRVVLDARWSMRDNVANAHYVGKIADSGGTILGQQVWTNGGRSTSRPCAAAFVPAPKFEAAAEAP